MSLLTVSGEVAAPRPFTFEELLALPEQVPDIGELLAGKRGGGVRLRSILASVGARARFLTLCAADGFSICVPQAAVEGGVVAFRLGDGPLPEKEGGPVRFYLARQAGRDGGDVDECANVKRLVEIRVTATPGPDTHRH